MRMPPALSRHNVIMKDVVVTNLEDQNWRMEFISCDCASNIPLMTVFGGNSDVDITRNSSATVRPSGTITVNYFGQSKTCKYSRFAKQHEINMTVFSHVSD